MAPELFRRGFLDQTRTLIAWCVGVALYALLLAAVFPSLKGATDLNELVEKYPEALKSLLGLSAGINLTTGSGYFDAELFGFMLPLFALILAIGSGARTLAGEEESGRLELLFAYPPRRRSGVLAKGAAVGAEVVLFAAAVFAALSVLDPIFGLGLSASRLAGAMVGIAVLALLHGWLAIAVAAVTPSRALATGVPAALAAAAYLIAGLHDLAGWLDPLRFASSFWWVGRAPLQQGVSAVHVLVVVAGGGGALSAAAYFIERRDLRTP
jgi:beta-exotoxin I transport system permease protein